MHGLGSKNLPCSAHTNTRRDDLDAAQATLSLIVNRKESFSPIENIGKFIAR